MEPARAHDARRAAGAVVAALRNTPYRALFFAGALQLVAAMLWWTAVLAAVAAGRPAPAATVPAPWAHAALMIYALFPFFIYGFALTIYPRWLGDTEAPARLHLPAAALLGAGALLLHAGLFVSRALVFAALAALGAGLVLAVTALLRAHCVRRSLGGAREIGVLAPLLCAPPCLAAGIAWLVRGWPPAYRVFVDGGVWFFLVPAVLAVAARMIPYFSRAALPDPPPAPGPWVAPVLVLLSWGHGLLAVLGRVDLLALVDLPLAGLGLWLCRAWGFGRASGERLLRMLRLAFAWFPLGMILYAWQDLSVQAGYGFVLGRAPLHALALGFLAAMVLAMVARVTQAHAGGPRAAPALTWRCFQGLQAAALLRVAAELPGAGALAPWAMLAAALLWLAASVPWAARYAPACWRLRPDGHDGA